GRNSERTLGVVVLAGAQTPGERIEMLEHGSVGLLCNARDPALQRMDDLGLVPAATAARHVLFEQCRLAGRRQLSVHDLVDVQDDLDTQLAFATTAPRPRAGDARLERHD